MNIYEANMFDSRKLNLRLFIDAMKLDKQLTGSYNNNNNNIYLKSNIQCISRYEFSGLTPNA